MAVDNQWYEEYSSYYHKTLATLLPEDMAELTVDPIQQHLLELAEGWLSERTCDYRNRPYFGEPACLYVLKTFTPLEKVLLALLLGIPVMLSVWWVLKKINNLFSALYDVMQAFWIWLAGYEFTQARIRVWKSSTPPNVMDVSKLYGGLTPEASVSNKTEVITVADFPPEVVFIGKMTMLDGEERVIQYGMGTRISDTDMVTANHVFDDFDDDSKLVLWTAKTKSRPLVVRFGNCKRMSIIIFDIAIVTLKAGYYNTLAIPVAKLAVPTFSDPIFIYRTQTVEIEEKEQKALESRFVRSSGTARTLPDRSKFVLYHSADTESGNSGAPIFQGVGKGRRVVGVHSGYEKLLQLNVSICAFAVMPKEQRVAAENRTKSLVRVEPESWRDISESATSSKSSERNRYEEDLVRDDFYLELKREREEANTGADRYDDNDGYVDKFGNPVRKYTQPVFKGKAWADESLDEHQKMELLSHKSKAYELIKQRLSSSKPREPEATPGPRIATTGEVDFTPAPTAGAVQMAGSTTTPSTSSTELKVDTTSLPTNLSTDGPQASSLSAPAKAGKKGKKASQTQH